MKWKLEQQERKLDNLFRTVEKVEDEEIKAFLSKLLCVRTSGFVENSIRNLVGEYAIGTCPKAIQSFVHKELKYVTNLKYKKLLDILGTFDSTWKDKFEEEITERQKTSLNSIVSNRNNIAHGENDSLSYSIIKEYYNDVKEIVDILKRIIKK